MSTNHMTSAFCLFLFVSPGSILEASTTIAKVHPTSPQQQFPADREALRPPSENSLIEFHCRLQTALPGVYF